MSIENEIKRLTAAITELTNAVAAATENGTAPAPVEEPAQASPAATAPTPEPETTDVFDGEPEPAVEAPAVEAPAVEAPAVEAPAEAYDKKQIIAAVIALAKKRGRDVASSMMAEFGHKKASEFNDAAEYPAVMAKIAELMES